MCKWFWSRAVFTFQYFQVILKEWFRVALLFVIKSKRKERVEGEMLNEGN